MLELGKYVQSHKKPTLSLTAGKIAEMYTICKINGWVRPTVYQGGYNILDRGMETEYVQMNSFIRLTRLILPCSVIPALRKYGIRLLAYNPLG